MKKNWQILIVSQILLTRPDVGTLTEQECLEQISFKRIHSINWDFSHNAKSWDSR